MKYLVLRFLLFFMCFFSCKSTEQKTVKQQLALTQKEYKIVKNDKEVIDGLYGLINDSIDIKKINDPLIKYFDDKNRKELITIIELYSIFGNGMHWKTDKLDSTDMSIPRINSLEELKVFKKNKDEALEATKKAFNKKYKKKDSL